MDNTVFAGPDQIVPATNLTTFKRNGHVHIRIPESGKAIETQPAISVPSFLQRTADAYPENIALAQKVDGKWQKTTYKLVLLL